MKAPKAYCASCGREWIYPNAPTQAEREPRAMRDALIGLNAAIDDYWNEGRTDGQVKNICYWQLKAKQALALSSPNLGGGK